MKKLAREMKRRGFALVPNRRRTSSHLMFEKDGIVIRTSSTPTNVDITIKNAVQDWLMKKAGKKPKGR